ncbi:MAG: acetyltransferase [Ramlibacter sp.]
MAHFDVFNGDADGLCARQQLRLAGAPGGVAVTGVKRDVALLQRVPAQPGDSVTVLDVSLERNRGALQALLARGVAVEYFDHHFAGAVPAHPLLTTHLDPAPDVCTSVLVDRHLHGRHRAWAVVGAFGDNLPATAEALADTLGLARAQRDTLRTLGEAINYNAYGEREADLLVAPAQLSERLLPHADPLVFAAEDPLAAALARHQARDLGQALRLAPVRVTAGASAYVLPDTDWARRVQGAFANLLAQRAPQRAHAVLCPASGGSFAVSVRAPAARPGGADALCRAFPTGGGRTGAAGIDALPAADLEPFLAALAAAFPGG